MSVKWTLLHHETLIKFAKVFISTSKSIPDNDITYNNAYMDSSYLLLPLILFGLGMLSIVLFHLTGIAAYCCNCRLCVPLTDETSKIFPSGLVINRRTIDNIANKYKKQLFRALIGFVVVVVIIDQLNLLNIIPLFVRSPLIYTGFNLIRESILFCRSFVSTIYKSIYSLNASGTSLSTSISSSTCSYLVDATDDDLASFQDAISTSMSVTSTSKDTLNEIIDQLNENFRDEYIYLLMILVYLLPIITIGLLIRGYRKNSISTMKFSIGFGSVSYVIMLSLCVLWLLALTIIVNVCDDDPLVNILSMTGSDDPDGAASSYYAYFECNTNSAPDSLNKHLLVANESLFGMAASIDDLMNGACVSDAVSLLTVKTKIVDDMVPLLADLSDSFNCQQLKEKFYTGPIVNGICIDLFEGFLFVWVSQQTICLFMFLIFFLSSILYQYIPRTTTLERSDEASQYRNTATNNKSPRSSISESVFSGSTAKRPSSTSKVTPFETTGNFKTPSIDESKYDFAGVVPATTNATATNNTVSKSLFPTTPQLQK